jgi:hypothetical protein
MQLDELDGLLERLPLRIGVYVPDDILAQLFPPGTADGILDPKAREAAVEYAGRFDCEFEYDEERREGTFWKFVPAL